ncbi:NOL1/NOP2/sun family putative RNA methylase [Candidatus Micrarchaeota archaeon]|nr:NOL1/NOP2/sun family putative RNA methylase [Candidatus Micrarchaeota archaeon]
MSTMVTGIPKVFRQRYASLVDDPEAFFSCLGSMQPRSFRVNTLKSGRKHVVERFEGYGFEIKQVPWYRDAFVSAEPDVGSTLEHFTGEIYMQELVSMLPPVVLRKDLMKAKNVLDGCAAPGSKATQMAAIMGNMGLIVANDVSYSRIKALKFNQEKTGAANMVITNLDLRNFPQHNFDIVLLDAPCSAEGTIRKSCGISEMWSERHIKKLSSLQKQLIVKAFDLMSPGGLMVYSTCTFAPEENESVVNHLVEKRPARLEEIDVPGFRLSDPLQEWRGETFSEKIKNCIRVWPHHNNTGGFFMARVGK